MQSIEPDITKHMKIYTRKCRWNDSGVFEFMSGDAEDTDDSEVADLELADGGMQVESTLRMGIG